jgi:hypothetical protein
MITGIPRLAIRLSTGFAAITGSSDFPRPSITGYGLGLLRTTRPIIKTSGRSWDRPVLAHGDSAQARVLGLRDARSTAPENAASSVAFRQL